MKRRSRKHVRAKKGGNRTYKIRCKKSKKKSFRMINAQLKSKTKTKGNKFGGGGGGSQNHKNCFKTINHYGLANKTPRYTADIVPYSTLARTKKHCYDYLKNIYKHRKMLPKKAYKNQIKSLVPIVEKLQKAMDIQKKEAKLTYYTSPHFEDMMEYKLKQLKRR